MLKAIMWPKIMVKEYILLNLFSKNVMWHNNDHTHKKSNSWSTLNSCWKEHFCSESTQCGFSLMVIWQRWSKFFFNAKHKISGINAKNSLQEYLNLNTDSSEYCTHAVKTKKGNYNVQGQKKERRLIAKDVNLQGKRKVNTVGWNLRLILS